MRRPEAAVVSLLFALFGCAGKIEPSRTVESGTPSRANAESVLATQATFAGIWRTTYGTMRLAVEGDRVSGTYRYGEGATVEGVIAGREANLRYREADGTLGRAVFRLDDSGARFDGVWSEGESGAALSLDDSGLQRWSGERVEPRPGRRWLVILEVHWEEGLSQPEFSYGSMLRSFFQRVPNIEVRHRFVHDRADFIRFLRELDEIPDPAVVYVSSHGTKDGLQTPGGTIGGRAIGEALRLCGSIELLHFGACSALSGDFAERIREAVAPHESFPISGYRRDADWAGSAIVDFAYLSLILEHGMSPKDAVEEVRRSIEFAGERDREGAAIAGVDLVIR